MKRKTPKAGMVPKAAKRPAAPAAVTSTKRPFAGAPAMSESQEQLSWRLSLMDLEGAWGWASVEAERLIEIRKKLCELERFSWAQLDRQKHHRIEVADVCAAAQQRLRKIKREDVEGLHTLRLTGKQRVWGVLHGNVFYVLWWDPEHTVCPSQKKHT